jgi:hypothetical protein
VKFSNKAATTTCPIEYAYVDALRVMVDFSKFSTEEKSTQAALHQLCGNLEAPIVHPAEDDIADAETVLHVTAGHIRHPVPSTAVANVSLEDLSGAGRVH